MNSPFKQDPFKPVTVSNKQGFSNLLNTIDINSKTNNMANGIDFTNASMSGDFSDPFDSSIMSNASDQFSPKSGGMSDAMAGGLIGGVVGIAQGLIGRKKRRAQQRKAKAEYQTRRNEYENLDTSNLAAGFKNSYLNMENTFEDLTVNQKQAQFQSQQNQQSQANIMQNLQGAAGGSGIGSLAQALANQSQMGAQAASASIGAQESANQRAKAQGAASIQQLEAGGDQFAQMQRLAGASKSRSLQYDKTSTLLGMAQADRASADKAIQDSNAALFGGIGSIAGAALTGGVSSLLK
tara:strand:+ start:17 stop:901 length:885 start_codon:yes stop_codon:yes gene_type:complete